jgi:hypothetical protein
MYGMAYGRQLSSSRKTTTVKSFSEEEAILSFPSSESQY